jgi:hypothetical protein
MGRSKKGGKEKVRQKFHYCPAETEVLPEKEQKFNNRVSLGFEDGSKATFEYAFYKLRDQYIDIYTEHCGYHSFYRLSVVHYGIQPYGLNGIEPPEFG